VHPRGDIVPTGALDVRPGDILNREARTVAVLSRVDAGRHVYRLVNIAELKVSEGDVSDVTLTRICLDPCRVGRVVAFEVLEQDVIDRVGAVSVAEGADHGAPGFVACHVADVDVFAVGFDRDAVLQGSHVW